jgi:hypothetical protein
MTESATIAYRVLLSIAIACNLACLGFASRGKDGSWLTGVLSGVTLGLLIAAMFNTRGRRRSRSRGSFSRRGG